MQDVVAGTDDSLGAIVSDLISLLEQVQASITLVNAAIARERSHRDRDAADVIVLDDVTPQYLTASHALQACDARLELALQSLIEAKIPAQGSIRLASG